MSAELEATARAWIVAFVALMLLAVVWPAPVLFLGRATAGPPADLGVDSFLGHEAPRWDVVFWAIAGLFLIGIVVPRRDAIREWKAEWMGLIRRAPRRVSRRWQSTRGSSLALFLLFGALVVALTVLFIDERVVIALETLEIRAIYAPFHYANRLAGGQNPSLIVVFTLVAALALERRRWLSMALAMTAAGAVSGIAVHLLKHGIRRARPELWTGAFARVADASAASFPSGHTMAACVIGGVIAFGSRDRATRIVAVLVALTVAVARVVSFRHWPSDVVGSALIGGGLAWFFTRALVDGEEWVG